MINPNTLRDLLIPELESEFDKTRKVLRNVPDGNLPFKPHEKSMALSHLAGHVADLPVFITNILSTPSYDFGIDNRKPYHMETTQATVAQFEENADHALTALKHASDETLHQHWSLAYKGHGIFSGSRYKAYREMGLNHLIHHRAQLGVYLRLLNAHVPGTFGPSADEPWTG